MVRDAQEIHRQACLAIRAASGDEAQIMRMIQYFSEESHIVEAQLSAGIEALEQIAEIAHKVLRKGANIND
ncbi:hypothetical protein [Paenibacillus silvisoli]|uniref:hypothetical protein n=1 Tax=Paenibacillus silvisoli TaxID=3110539 RepID=UPI002804FF8E|nr:hypothetical protein [Paenibacillus silvisoli]